jgi:hypothetical protein
MSKKKLQVDGITNELEGASLFFTKQFASPTPTSSIDDISTSPESTTPIETPIESKPLETNQTQTNFPPEISNEQTNDRSNERTDERTSNRNNKRKNVRNSIRHSFDVFADQLISLREIALEQEKLFGEKVLLGDLVKQALDMLITKENNT